MHNDCERLIEWMPIEKDENGFVFAPYSEIVVGMETAVPFDAATVDHTGVIHGKANR